MFLLLFLLWLIAPLVELGVIIALCIRIEEYKKEIASLSRQKDSAVLKEALIKAKERAEDEVFAEEEEPFPQSSQIQEGPREEPSVSKAPILEASVPDVPVQKEKTMATGAMVIGVVLVVLAGLVFATTTWRILPSVLKVFLVLLFSGIFYGASFLAENKLHLHRTGSAFYVLSCIFVFLSVLAAAYFQLIGSAFILEGANRWWVLWLGSLMTVCMMFLGIRRYCDQIYIQACFWGMTISMSFLMIACQVTGEQFLCGMIIYASLLAAAEWVLKKRVLNLKEESVRKLLADNFGFFSMTHFWVFALLMMVYAVFTGFYGVGSLSGGLGILAMASLAAGTVFQAQKIKWNGVKAFFSLAFAGALHSFAAWGYRNLNGEGNGILDAFFSNWDVILMILGAQIAVFACLLAGKKKRIWLHTVYGDGIKTGILAYDWLLLAVNAVWGKGVEWQFGALAGTAVLAVAVSTWEKEVPVIKMVLPFLFWYMLFPLRSLIGGELPVVSQWIDRGGVEFMLLAGLALWDHRKKSGFYIPVCIIGVVAQIVYFSETQISFPFFFLLSAATLGQGLAYSYEAASLCSMAGTYLLAFPMMENGVLRGLLVVAVYGIWMAVKRMKTVFWDICGCVLVIGLMAEFYLDGNLEIWNLLLCLAVFLLFYIRFYMGNRMWPHLLITLAVLFVPLILYLRYHWSEDLLYMVVGGMYLATGMISRYFSFIIHQDGQVSGGWRVDWYHVLGIVVIVSMIVGASGDERWRFGYLLLLSLYFLQYAKVKPWRRPAWALAFAMLVIAFWNQPFVEWPIVLETEIALLPAAGYIWFAGRLFQYGKDPQKTILETGGYVLCLLVLCVDAWMTKNVIDALILEGLCLFVFLWAQVVKCRRWVRISGGLMMVLALYMTKDFWLNISWWVYLLAAGIGLILFAAIKEKKR